MSFQQQSFETYLSMKYAIILFMYIFLVITQRYTKHTFTRMTGVSINGTFPRK